MARYEEYYRARNITVSIHLSPEEYRNMEERIKITGLAKNKFIYFKRTARCPFTELRGGSP